MTEIQRRIAGKRILITGGTGSFGRKVALRLREMNPKDIIVFSRDEKKQYEMQLEHRDFRYVLGDVREPRSVAAAMRHVDIVFHAAALKQVPNCEEWPLEAIRTNALGSANVLEAAENAGVSVVVGLSTDKAVEPVNTMGITKALMEKLVTRVNARDSAMIACCVRYGNVLGSRGSVLPVFLAQAKRGGPLTLTDPTMTRFLLTLDQAVELVFFAMENATGGEIFVRKAPACTVDLLADAVTQITGKALEKKVVGVRVGEKLHEVLVSEHEMRRSIDRGDFYVLPKVAGRVSDAHLSSGAVGEYTSQTTHQLTALPALMPMIDAAMKDLESAV